MNKLPAAVGLILLTATGSALASGYRIPEQSVNSTARAGSYVAYTPGADAAYYNPANMSWLEDRAYLEADATWIHLNSVAYADSRSSSLNGSSEAENFFMPTFFAVSPDYNNFRVGFSVTAPAGLSKRWQDPYPRTFAEEFSLKVFEFNPTLSYKFSDRLAVGAGVRAIYVDGKVKSNGIIDHYGSTAIRDMDGDALEAGYNLAVTARPTEDMNISVTYRSEVDLGIEGHADLNTNVLSGRYSGDTGVEIPLPAILAVAVSYTFFDQLTVELEYDQTYWSDYAYLDFTYPAPFANPVFAAAFDDAKAKHWSDTNAWRLSVTYDLKNDFILMAGFAIDENPVPEATLGFELPDSDALLYSAGVRYKVNKDMELGVAYLYDDKESRSVNNGTVKGTIDEAGAHLLTFGLTYAF
ncbi:membrane protein involved in aromatic hydrocarbon degradation [Desulfobulbus propionicus DSM 2032]|uniref:Membrane protein involved in aromatic hydrocarbon degradation n=1 Tax=Desulfobulbus propionicus (strain ATCC 33891 / DSM 2032 / VKM B-1956 / 1pr3) TaxID=577650 RepID=A0A7U4DQE7_DESPD|nr:porin [Desulfobulbus propionicus]ADW19042.1 membrane protein involved in aromatic hydrocarbon degradation [Desulfobulbus propionicus DSM 2032]